jgi:hypothetical protein
MPLRPLAVGQTAPAVRWMLAEARDGMVVLRNKGLTAVLVRQSYRIT